jgi:cobalt/nickel transport system permease protein
LLAGNLFQRGLDRARRLDIGLAARGYTGELRVLTPERRLSWLHLATGMMLVGGVGLLSGLLAREWP